MEQSHFSMFFYTVLFTVAQGLTCVILIMFQNLCNNVMNSKKAALAHEVLNKHTPINMGIFCDSHHYLKSKLYVSSFCISFPGINLTILMRHPRSALKF